MVCSAGFFVHTTLSLTALISALFQRLGRFPLRGILTVCLFLFADASLPSGLIAQVPALLSYQGRIIENGSVYSGTGLFLFELIGLPSNQSINQVNNPIFWANSPHNFTTGRPNAAVALTVNSGLCSVLLGDTNVVNMAAISPSVFQNSEVYLRVWFSDGTNAFAQLSPDQRIASVGYALIAAHVANGAITTDQLAPGTLNVTNLAGILAQSQLPANVAYRDVDLIALSNALSADYLSRLLSLSNLFETQLCALSNSVSLAINTGLLSTSNALALQLISVATATSTTNPPPPVAVSSDSADTNLLSKQYTEFYSVPAQSWSNGSGTSAPGSRYSQTGVWMGQRFFVWGGLINSTTPSGGGGIYDPALDSWSSVPVSSSLSARSGHILVTDGTSAYAWGGLGTTGYLNTGARYATDGSAWTALPTSGAPTARSGHIGVWSGDSLVVWGGRNGSGLLSDGGVYSPSTQSWTPLPTSSAPSARWGATAVWTGNSMIVWGGIGAAGDLSTGGVLLCPCHLPSWQTLPTLNSPSARDGHTVVWTGSKMIVWGGRNGSALYSDGAAYDPVAQVWTSLPTTGAPTARYNHSAVWTGTEMLIVGGEGASTSLASGAAYNPQTGAWRSLSSTGSPLARSSSSATWTGSQILTFGGLANGSPTASLQRLDPTPGWYFYKKF